jgi:hypothetical protein
MTSIPPEQATHLEKGALQDMLIQACVTELVTTDLTPSVTPMLQLFFLAYVPSLIINLLGLHA